MKFTPTVFISLLLVPTALISTASANSSEKWFLMSKHGECVEIRSLQRKIPDIEGIEDPQSFSKLMEEKGYEVITNEPKELQGKAVEVSVPKEGLSLMFVVESVCKEFADRE